MKRPGLVALGVALAAVAASLLYTTLAREAEYRRLMAAGQQALASDQPFVAIEDFSGAIVLKPASMPAYLHRGEAYRRRGDLQTALRDLRKASELDRAALRPLEELGDVNFALERFARAAESYDAYVALDERSANVLYKLALCRFRLGDPATASRWLGQAVRLNDRFAEAFYLLGLCQGQMGQATAAINTLARAVELQPNTMLAAREEMIRLLLLLQRDNDAIRELEQLATLQPTRLDPLIDAALIYGRLGRTDLAIAELNRVAERDPAQPRFYQALGRIWLEAPEARHDRFGLNKALDALGHAVRAPDASSEAFTLYGRALLLAGDVAGAQQALDEALARSPVDATAYREVAGLARRRGDLATARDALVRYIALAPDDHALPGLAEDVADLCLRLDDRPAAARWLKQAAESADDDPVTMSRLAMMQLQAGDRAGAAMTVERGLRQTPGHTGLVALQRRLTGE